MVRELFEMARSKKACIIFFDEVDAVGGARFDDGAGGDNEVQRTMLELINQLDGFDPRGNIKVLMATNRQVIRSPSGLQPLETILFTLYLSPTDCRPDTLDPALMRPGRLDRKIEFSLPDLEVRSGHCHVRARKSESRCLLGWCFTCLPGSCKYSEDSRKKHERGAGYSIRADCPSLPECNWSRTALRLHGGGNVCHPSAKKNCDREGLFGIGKQGHQTGELVFLGGQRPYFDHNFGFISISTPNSRAQPSTCFT